MTKISMADSTDSVDTEFTYDDEEQKSVKIKIGSNSVANTSEEEQKEEDGSSVSEREPHTKKTKKRESMVFKKGKKTPLVEVQILDRQRSIDKKQVKQEIEKAGR